MAGAGSRKFGEFMTPGTSVVVTGRAGFIGSHVAERFLDRATR